VYPLIYINSNLEIPTYFLMISLACSLGLVWFWRRALARNLSAHMALDLSLVIFISGFVGARILHVIWEEPKFYIENPALIFNIFSGGYVFLGGVLGATLGAYFFCRWKKESFFQWADVVAPVISFGYAFGRIGCFLRGCCYGKVCQLPWAVTFPSHEELGIALEPRHPTQLYASLIEVGIMIYLLRRERYASKTGEIFLLWVVMHCTARVFLEIFRDDPRGFAPLGVSLATWLSLIFIALAIKYQSRART
jgi:phosphatidylglycerol:prolipoprotein diacylglycerol transferase